MSATPRKQTRSILATGAATLLYSTAATAALDIPDMPLFLTSTGVPPNIVLTLDDSGSMSRAFTPDLCGNPDGICTNHPDNRLNPRYLKSAHYNPLYYNPTTTYAIPPDAAGNPVSSPSFNAAHINGFEPGRGSVDLAADYRPAAGLYLSRSTEDGVYWEYMNHYPGDLTAAAAGWATHSDTAQMQGINAGANAPWFAINDFVDADGTANGSNPGTNIVTVTVNGNLAARVGNFAGACSTANDPGRINQYKTKIVGGTLTLCFRDDNAMYGKQVVVTHRTGANIVQVPIGIADDAPAYYYLFDASNASCDGTAIDNDCYDIRIVSATSGPDGSDERQNFANWYSFYRTRNLATVSATALAFSTLPATTRVAWQALNSCRGGAATLVTADCEGWEATNPNFSNAIKPFTGGHKDNFYTWLFRLKTRSSTPLPDALERAGDYFSSGGSGSPYDNDLAGLDDTEYACRRNFHVMMTDGIWNTGVGGYDNYDSTGRTLPDGVQYASRRPYLDANINSLADIAFRYWATDLRDLDNNIPGYVRNFAGSASDQYFNPENNPADWQHMVNFTVGLGLTPFLNATGLTWAGATHGGSYAEILAGTKDWPGTSSAGVDGNVADLWHAAVNSRGKFYSAENPTALVAAFQEIIDTISSIAASGGGAGLSSNTTQIDQQGAVVFEAKFNADWSGRILARPVQGDFSLGTAYWDAGQLIPAATARKIFTFNEGPEAFRACSGPLAIALATGPDGDPDGLCAERLNWLRGDGKITHATWTDFDPATNTVTATFSVNGHGFVSGDSVTISDVAVSENPAPALGYNGPFTVTDAAPDSFTVAMPSTVDGPGTYAGGGRARYTQFRNRTTSVLGDIVNSDLVYSYRDDFGYGGSGVAIDGKDAYATFVHGKETRPPMLYAGVNDGMLHGFRADIGGPSSGVELFAYVPRGVYGNLSKLTDPLYSHKYYVDGQMSIGDAYLHGEWGSYLVGSLGAGGRSVFALDISNPVDFAATDVKWELSDPSDLGLTFGKPQITAIAEDTWAVVFGNGYNSSDGQAYLYVVDLSDGTQVAKVATTEETDNGLSTPHLYDSNGDKVVDVAYAGDLRGNLWKFINDTGSWLLGNGGFPLFTARGPYGEIQPITSEPKLAIHPAGGVLVYFGTGSYVSTDDLTNDDTQTFYAIWDKADSVGTLARADLQPYSIVSETTILEHTARTTSEASVDWSTQGGWYLDLPTTPGLPSERIVSTPLVMEFVNAAVPDRVLFVTNTPAPDPCSRGGTTWLMELDLITGGHTTTSVFDLNDDGTFDADDTFEGVPLSGIALPLNYGITGEPLLLKTRDGNIVKEFSGSTGISGTAEGPLQQGDPPAAAGAPTRIYWRQML